jgi:triphosphatase
MRSKAQRGYRLLGTAAVPRPVQAKPVAFDATMTVEAALQCFGQRCIAHLLRNEVVALTGDSEAIHQNASRGTASSFRASGLKTMLPADQCRWASEELKWLTHALGPARNWDIFVGDLVHPVTDALPDRRELEQLLSAAGQLRRSAFDDAKQAILSERHTESMLRPMRWFAACGWRDQPISEKAAPILAPAVERCPERD